RPARPARRWRGCASFSRGSAFSLAGGGHRAVLQMLCRLRRRKPPRPDGTIVARGGAVPLDIVIGRALACCVYPSASWRRLPPTGRVLLVAAYVGAGYVTVLTLLFIAGCRPGSPASMATTTAASPWSWSQWRKARASVLPARDVSAWRRGLPPALGHQPDEAAVVGEPRDRVDVLVIAAPAVLVFHPVVHPRVRRRI